MKDHALIKVGETIILQDKNKLTRIRWDQTENR